jgi:NAD(P)H dehydrogenase (quinone)
MILVTGAAGKTGRAVIQDLAAKGQRVRGLVRRQEQSITLERLGVLDYVVGDMGAQETLEEAAEGVKAIYHICPNMHPDEVTIGERIIRAAQSAGIERFVYHSVLHPQIEIMAHHWQKMRVEEKLFESGLSYTILQPAAYMQNVLANWDRIKKDGAYTVPYGLQTRLSMVDLQDVAEVAGAVLTERGHEGAIYELCGGEILSQSEVARILGVFLGREVAAEVILLEQWEEEARSVGLSDYTVDTLLKMFRYYDEFGFWGSGRVLGWLLGHSPTTFTDFLGELDE